MCASQASIKVNEDRSFSLPKVLPKLSGINELHEITQPSKSTTQKRKMNKSPSPEGVVRLQPLSKIR